MVIKMTKYSFILLSEMTDTFLNQIQELGVMDITRSVKPIDADSSAMLEKAAELKQTVTFLKTVDYSGEADVDAIVQASKQCTVADNPAQRVRILRNRLAELEAQTASLEREKHSRLPWGEFDSHKLEAVAQQGLDMHYYMVPKKKFDPQWEQLHPLQVVEDDGKNVWFVTVSEKGEDYRFPVDEIPAPGGSASECDHKMAELSREIVLCKAELLRQREAITTLEQEYGKGLSDLDLYLAKCNTESAAEGKLSLVVGFAPTEEDARLETALDAMDVYYLKEPATVADNPPVKLKNRWFGRMFEVLTGMYGQPVYNEFDPTPILAPFFLLFFAMCMGDAGYGIILYIIGCFLKGKDGGLAKSWRLIKVLGVGTFVVGILLGTFFGIDLYNASWVPEWLKRCMIKGTVAGFDVQMILALGIGVFHICLAMVIKAINNTRRFGFKESTSVWGWTLLIVGGVIVAAATMLLHLPMNVVKWVVIALAAVSALGIFIFNKVGRNPLLNIGAGLWDTYQMVSGLLGDVLSYIRLFALGLAGGMLGAAFNNLAMMILGSHPTYEWVFFIIVLVIGHGLNLAMSCLGAFVHPLRLTFVEFFKNSGYEGKGVAYHPLKNN